MLFILSKFLSFILSPVIWIFILFAFGVFIKNDSKKRKLLLCAFILLLLFTNPFITNKVLNWWEIKPVNSETIIQPYNIGIVMGGSTRFYNSETKRLVYATGIDRVLQAIDLYKAGKIKKILLTGGSGFVNFPDMKEAILLRSELLKMCIPDSDIIIENESRNTYENALFTTQLIKSKNVKGSILLITSALHIRRSLACFKKQGVILDVYPVDERSGFQINTPDRYIVPNAWCLTDWDALMHEWFGFGYYKIAGYV